MTGLGWVTGVEVGDWGVEMGKYSVGVGDGCEGG